MTVTMGARLLWCQLALLVILQFATTRSQTTGASMVTMTVDAIGDDVILECTDNMAAEDITWTLTSYNSTLTADSDNPNPSVIANGTQLSIMDVAYGHLGEYTCNYTIGNDSFSEVIVLELREPSLWEMYRMQTIVGVSAAAAFFVICLVIGLVCVFQWRPDGEKEGLDDNWNNPAKQRLSHGNEGYVGEAATNKVYPAVECMDTHV